jgi:hypothetical protein
MLLVIFQRNLLKPVFHEIRAGFVNVQIEAVDMGIDMRDFIPKIDFATSLRCFEAYE